MDKGKKSDAAGIVRRQGALRLHEEHIVLMPAPRVRGKLELIIEKLKLSRAPIVLTAAAYVVILLIMINYLNLVMK